MLALFYDGDGSGVVLDGVGVGVVDGVVAGVLDGVGVGLPNDVSRN